MEPENVHIGATVRVREHHKIAERRGMEGRITDCYGGGGYVAVDVRFPDGQRRLFRPEDLEEISPSQPWWHSVLGMNRNARARVPHLSADRGFPLSRE
jgi:hypothetical protein